MSDDHILFLATGAYTGHAKTAPGTVGTLVGIPLFLVLSLLSTPALLPYLSLVTIAFIIFSVYIAEKAVTILDREDPGCVVIDEIAGYLVTTLGFAFSIKTALLAFILFRFFDILKPFPVKFLEDTIPGGAGVVLDDVAAGIMAHIVLSIMLALF